MKINWQQDTFGTHRGELTDHIHFKILPMQGHVILQVPGVLNRNKAMLTIPCKDVESAKAKALEYCEGY